MSSVGTGLCQPVPWAPRSFPCPFHPPPGLYPPPSQGFLEHLPVLRFSFSHCSFIEPESGRNPPQHPGPSPRSPSAQDLRCCPSPLPGPPLTFAASRSRPLPAPSPRPRPRPRALPLAEMPPSSSAIGCRSGRVPRAPPLPFLHRLPGRAAPQARERLVEGEEWRPCTSIMRRRTNENGIHGVGGPDCQIRAWRSVARRRERGRARKGLNSIAFNFWPFPWKITSFCAYSVPVASPGVSLLDISLFIFGLKQHTILYCNIL